MRLHSIGSIYIYIYIYVYCMCCAAASHRVYTYTYIHTCTVICIYIYTYKYVYMCKIYIYSIFICKYTHVYIYIYVHIYIHKYRVVQSHEMDDFSGLFSQTNSKIRRSIPGLFPQNIPRMSYTYQMECEPPHTRLMRFDQQICFFEIRYRGSVECCRVEY